MIHHYPNKNNSNKNYMTDVSLLKSIQPSHVLLLYLLMLKICKNLVLYPCNAEDSNSNYIKLKKNIFIIIHVKSIELSHYRKIFFPLKFRAFAEEILFI